MDVFNPKILDACIRDVSSCLTDTQKADLVLYALRSLRFEGRSRTIIENAIESCLQITTLSPESTAKARILRARARLAAGSHFGAQEDLQAALVAEPDNPEAKALLYQRSVAVEKLLAPIPVETRRRFSIEIWREIASYLPRHDLTALLFVSHAVSRVASQLLFQNLDLHFGTDDREYAPGAIGTWVRPDRLDEDEETRHAQRSADILTRIIVDSTFASAVKTLRIYAPLRDREGAMAFQTGMLTNALPKLINLRNVHISAGSEGIMPVLRILQSSMPRLRGLSLHSAEGPPDLVSLEFRHLFHFAYSTVVGNSGQVQDFLAQNGDYLRTLCLENQDWTFASNSLSIRNLTHITFTGHIPAASQAFFDILSNGRQLESLTLYCSLDAVASTHFRSLRNSLPFLKHFAFSVHSVHRRLVDRDLFPSIADFLRGRHQLKTLQLAACNETVQKAVGFDASVWGVLPSLVNLRGLTITYPADLSPGLASWLIPRNLRTLALTLDQVPSSSRDPVPFLDQLRTGIPHTLRYIGLSDLVPFRNVTVIAEHGFPMARVVRVGNNYYTVIRGTDGVLRDIESWPKRKVLYHLSEWLEWHGCEDARTRDPSEFPL